MKSEYWRKNKRRISLKTPKSFIVIFKDWNVKRLTFEIDTEPYAKIRDDEISNLAEKNGIEVVRKTSHTLFSPNAIVQVNVES